MFLYYFDICKKCENVINCKITLQSGNLKTELTKEILKKAAIYATQTKEKNFRPYNNPTLGKKMDGGSKNKSK